MTMGKLQVISYILILWGTAGFLNKVKSSWKAEGTLFEYQDWSIWRPPLFFTILGLGKLIIEWLLSFFHSDSLLVFSMITKVLLFISILWFFKFFFKISNAALGLYFNQLSFRLILGLRWTVGYFLIFYGLIPYLFVLLISEVKYNQLLSTINFQEGNIIARYLNFFKETWGPHSVWFPIFYLAFFTPISEEIISRGFLYGPIRKKVGPWWGIFITAVLFMLAHGIFSLQLFIYGVLFGYIYERTQSLIPGIICHMLISSSFVIDYFLAEPVSYINFKTQVGLRTIILAIIFISVELAYRKMRGNGYSLKIPDSILQQS